jgi:hypothetical protein
MIIYVFSEVVLYFVYFLKTVNYILINYTKMNNTKKYVDNGKNIFNF